MKRILLASTAALAFSTAAQGQTTQPVEPAGVDQAVDTKPATAPPNTRTSEQAGQGAEPPPAGDGAIDTVVDDAPQPVQAPTPTGDPVIDRLNLLEARIKQLEARNAQLEAAAAETTERVQNVEVRAAKAVQPGVAPTFSDVAGDFTFRPRGVLEVDYAAYFERKGGYDYNNGTALRRARFGFEGTAFKDFRWRLDAEFSNQQANVLDAYISYALSPRFAMTVGQHKAPYGLEANSSDSYNTFLERGMASNAFGAVGAERRIGASLTYASDRLNGQVGVFGAPESVVRGLGGPDEAYGVNGRITFDPVLDEGKVVHVGASGYYVTNLASGAARDALRVSERPNSRVDGGVIVDSGVIPSVRDAWYVGAEAALVRGPFSLQAEYGRLAVERFDALTNPHFHGGYVFGSFFVTGESRTFKNGVVDRLKPFKNFSLHGGGPGAIELALRYDALDLGETPVVGRVGSDAESLTAAINWYLNPNIKVMLNYIRFDGHDSPLVDPLFATDGTTAAGDTVAARLHLDF